MAKGKKIKIGIDLGTNSIKIACFFYQEKA